MARTIGKLSPAKVKSASKPGLYADGGNLYLNVSATGTKSWTFRFMIDGRAREAGLGPLHTIGLGEARERARECRRQLLDGLDPIETRNAARGRARLAAAKGITFKTCAENYIKSHRAAWRSAKHTAQWTSSLATYVYPAIGELPVAAIETGHVTRILQPIWASKGETASRVRGRIELILDYGKVHGWREGPNPAQWKGHLQNVFPPARGRVRAVAHHAALPWRDVPTFVAELRGQDSITALALRFTILTAARTAETLGCRWPELDLRAATWIIPSNRMKGGIEHRVPLAPAVVALLRQMAELAIGPDAYVFCGRRPGQPLSSFAMAGLLQRMGRAEATTVHGLRSTFRDWCAEATTFTPEVCEAALAHVTGSKVEAAYRRSDLLDRRRELMASWATFCDRGPALASGEVVQLRELA